MNKTKPIYVWTAVLLAFLALTLQAHSTAANNQTITGQEGQWLSGFHLPGANDEVWAMADNGTDLYVGGKFTTIGSQEFNQIARFDGNNWYTLGTGMSRDNNLSPIVYALIWVDGNLYAAGQFDYADGVPAKNIARWDGSNWHALGAGTDGIVRGLAWDGTNLYAGGSFITAGGVGVNRVARWDGSNWFPLGGGVSGGIQAITWDGSNLYVGGYFNNAGGTVANHIARWDGADWHTLGTGVDSAVWSLFWDGSSIFVGGNFSTAGGVTVNAIAEWDGANWSALGSGMSGDSLTVADIGKYGNDLYASGKFVTAGGIVVNNIARWDGSDWHALGNGTADIPFTLEWVDDTLYVGGYFWSVGNNVLASRIAKWENNSWLPLADGNGVGGAFSDVYALTWDGNNVYAGGDFSRAGNTFANRVARWDGSSWSPLGSGVNNAIVDMIWVDGNLYAGGFFSSAGGIPAFRIARWDGAVWYPLGSGIGVSGWLQALAWDGQNLFAGGYFTAAGGGAANNMARWDGNNWYPLGSGLDDEVYTLLWADGNLYAGGAFTNAGSTPVNHIALWDGIAWHPLGSGMDDGVAALAWDGQNLYAGGYFTQAGGNPSDGLAKWDGSSWTSIDFDGVERIIYDLKWYGNELYATGRMSTGSGPNDDYIGRWDGTDWHPLGSGLDFRGFSLLWAENKLYVGGDFTEAGGMPSHHFAVWQTGPDFDIIVNPANTAVCPGDDAVYNLNITSYNNYTDTVTLSAVDNPAGTSAVFGQNPIMPPDSTTLTIGNTGSASPGSYAIDIVGVATTRTHTATVGLDILNPPPTLAPTLLTPANGATGVPSQPNFTWNSVANGSQYLLEVATDAAFNTIVYTKTLAGTSHTAETPLATGTEHFWRVTAANTCGSGPPSTPFSFTTLMPATESFIYLPAVLDQ